MLADSSFKLPVFVMSDAAETPFSTVDSDNKDCFSPDPESFGDVQLTQTVNINTANPDDRFDRPFQQHLDKVKPVMQWLGPQFTSTLSSTERERERDWKKDLHAIDVPPSEGFTPASCEFFKKAYAGELIFFCDTSFSRPQTNSHRLAVRVKAAWDQAEGGRPTRGGRLMLEAFVVKAEYFYTHARQHAHGMLAKGKLGLVLDLDKTLILTDPPQALGEQIAESGERDRLRQLRDGRWVALRAGVKDMLDYVHQQDEPLFELHVFCNGTLTYAREVLEIFDLIKYFGPRVTSGYWTTREELAFGTSGYKDFRSIFDFQRYSQYQEMVLAVDDMTTTWDNAVKLWRRVHEKPCVLQIRGYADNSTRMSQSNDTVSQFHEMLLKVHELFFDNEKLHKDKNAGLRILTMNTELHEARTPGFMMRCCAAAEKQLTPGAAAETPRLQGEKKLVGDLKQALADDDRSGVAELMKVLQGKPLSELFEVVRLLGLTTRLVRDEDGATIWRASSRGYSIRPVPQNLGHDQVRRIWIERVKAVYQTEPAQFELQVHFTNPDVHKARLIKVSVGMSMHDFLHNAILEWKKVIWDEMYGFFDGDMIGSHPMKELLDNPGLYDLTANGSPTAISSSSWYSLTHSLALVSTKTATLVLETSRYARAKYPALFAPAKSHFEAVGEGGVDPDVFLHQNHKMSGRVINRAQEHMANSIDATRNNQLQERNIDIELHEHTNELGNTLYAYTITDNGRGMSEVSTDRLVVVMPVVVMPGLLLLTRLSRVCSFADGTSRCCHVW